MNAWIKPLIRQAQSGDDAVARVLVGYLGACLECGEPPPPELAAYFAQAFKQIAAGRSTDDALNTSGDSATYRRDCEIAMAVWRLNHCTADPLPLRGNRKEKGAYSLVAEQYTKSAANVERIYKKMRWFIDAEVFGVVKETLDPGEERDGPELPEDVQQRTWAELHIVLSQLAEVLEKQGRV